MSPRALALYLALATTLPPSGALAQRSCDDALARTTERSWPAPLDAMVSLRARDVSLREALDRVSALAHVELAYASDLLPLDRGVCVVASNEPLGRVLAALLDGTGAEVVVVAGRVVLAPAAVERVAARRGATPAIGVLERVVVTGSAVAAPRRALTIGMDVIEGEQIRRQSLSTLVELFNAGVPGVWVWQGSPSTLVAQYGALRGTSSFGTSVPKIYIDGIEVANPLLFTQLDPDVVDHVEIIRGPQGSALYGSDAISGVVNVLTRHDGAAIGGPRLHLVSMAGAGNSAFGSALVPTHDQRLSLRLGSNLQSLGLGAQFSQSGAIFPASDTRQLLLNGDARLVGARSILTATVRFSAKRAGPGQNPLFVGIDPPAASVPSATSGSAYASSSPAPSSAPVVNDTAQSVQLYTAGVTGVIGTAGRWTHTLLAGVDGYRLDHVADPIVPIMSSVDSAIRAARGSADRATVRASSVARLGDGDGAFANSLTFGVEHSVLRQVSTVGALRAAYGTDRYPTMVEYQVERWNHNTGMLAQLGSAWEDRVFVTGGLRLERNDAFSGSDRYPLLPMLGVAVVQPVGGAEIKLRTAFGKGIRPPQTPARGMSYVEQWGGRQDLRSALDPESQTGIETGLELYVGRTFSLQVTRFDQLASGLIQNVAVSVDTVIHAGVPQRLVHYQLQNVGEIGNHGWELQSALRRGPLALSSALTLVDSRVRVIAPHYYGDLLPGDRLLGVPARTASVTASWTAPRWSAALSASRATDWVNYDRLALTRQFAATPGPLTRQLVGPQLRNFWERYDGETHLRLTASRDLGRGLGLVVTGDNLLGGQLGEPDNTTIRPGRTLTGGLRADF